MLVHGKERKFKLTVGASARVSEFCPDGDIARLEDALKGSYATTMHNIAEMIAALSEGYENARAYEEEGYKPCPLTAPEVLTLSMAELSALQSEALSAFNTDAQTSVDLAPSKKN